MYPTISEYIDAIRFAEDNLSSLSYLRPVLDKEGHVIMSSGNFAVVFKMRDSRNGDYYALKCFTREQDGRSKAYKEISKELSSIKSDYLISLRYLEYELFVDTSNSEETEFPVVLMDWVEGVTLDKYIQQYIGNSFELHDLCVEFAEMSKWLVNQSFAHGDLKPDNILVRPNGKLVLIDYDGMYTPSMIGQKAREIGSVNYRLPDRTVNDFNEYIDDFALAAISLSLKATSISYGILDKAGTNESFLFSESDYYNLKESETFQLLTELMYDDCSIAPYISTFILALNHTVLVPDNFNFGDTHVSDLITRGQCFTHVDEPMDEVGVIYSYDGKRVLKFDYSVSEETEIHIKEGVISICEDAFDNYKGRKLDLYLPKSLRFFTKESFDFQYSKLSWESPWFTYKDGIIYTRDFTGCIMRHLDVAKIDNRVRIIERNCFKNLNVSGLDLPQGLCKIKFRAFLHSFMDEELRMPEKVKVIEESAFEGCSNLRRVFLNENLQLIGSKCFSSCADIEFVSFPDECELKVISNESFCNCQKLRRIVFPSRLKIIGDEAFECCHSIDELSFPESLIEIGKEAFSMGRARYGGSTKVCSLKKITLPKCLANVGDSSFESCNSLQEVSVLGDDTSFGKNIFDSCYSLVSFDAKHLKKVSDKMFYGCDELSSVDCPNLLEIGNCAFEKCSSLSFSMPNRVHNVGSGAFNGVRDVIPNFNYIYENSILYNNDYSQLITCNIDSEKLIIPDGVVDVSSKAFKHAYDYIIVPNSLSDKSIIEILSLKNIYVQLPKGRVGSFYSSYEIKTKMYGDKPVFIDGFGVVYSEDRKNLLKFPMSLKLDNYSVIKTCEEISKDAFEGDIDCDGQSIYYLGNKLKKLLLPQGLLRICDHGLDGCVELTELKLPDELFSLGKEALHGCRSIQHITLPSSLEQIEANSFPAHLNSIENYSPWFKVIGGCLLSDDNELLWIPPNIDSLDLPDIFLYKRKICMAYKDSILSIEGELLWTLQDIEEFHFPDGVVRICSGAFRSNWHLRSLKIPKGVAEIEDGAFGCFYALKSFYLPSTLTHVGDLRTRRGQGKYVKMFYPEEIHVPRGMKRYFLDLLPDLPEKTLIDDYNE